MKKAVLVDVIKHIPVSVAVFKVIRVPEWADTYVKVGDEVSYNERAGCFVTKKNTAIALGASHIEFVRYELQHKL